MDITTSHDQILAGGGEMGRLMRAQDWASTSLGPVSSWPQSLRTAVSMMLETQFPMLIAWGQEFLMLYNDGYRPVLGASKHPALGRGLASVFPESWEQTIGPLFAQVMRGESVGFTDYLFLLDRYAYLEETYFLFSYSPIRDESGGIGGVLVTCTETTPARPGRTSPGEPAGACCWHRGGAHP